MKYLFFFSLFSNILFCQDKKFLFDVAYGLSYADNYDKSAKMLPPDVSQNLDMQAKNLGTAFYLNIEYKLFKDAYIGVGYLNQYSKGKVNESFYNVAQEEFITSDFLQIYNLHYSKYIRNWALTGGVFLYTQQSNGISLDTEKGIVMAGYKNNRLDNLGVFYSIGYQYPLYEYLSVGMRTQGYFCVLEGFTTANVSPYISFKF